MQGEDVGGVIIGKIVENVILNDVVRSVVVYQYALIVEEEIVLDSVGRSILKLEASSK